MGTEEKRRREGSGKASESWGWFWGALWRKIGRRVLFFAVFALWIIYILYCIDKRQETEEGKDGARNIVSAAGVLKEEEGEVSAISEASVRKVFEISELQAADYMYNTIATVYGEDGESVQYYVAYEGRVKAGIDFEQIEIDIDEEAKVISITIPEVEYQEVTVDPGTMEFIFRDKKSESENIHVRSYDLCLEDLRRKVDQEEELRLSAGKNIEAVVRGLVKPWVDQTGLGYEVEIIS